MAQAGNIVAKLQLKVDDFRKGIQDSQKQLTSFSNGTKAIAKGAGVAFAAIGTAVAGVGVAAAKMAMEQDDAMRKMQAATGSTKAEMEQFKDVADNLFANGRGNYEEIYNTLTQVKQVLGQTGKEAQGTADKALILSKTFGWEVTDSIRAASTAQKTFGVDSGKSFDMFTALAQQAGDKSGDLLDTFNEYSPIVSQMGLDFEDFGNILANGMDKGAFNFDKVGDALKEFNIRAQDGSKTTVAAFTDLGFNADSMGKKFAAGGKQGKEAFNQVITSLAKIKDPMKQNEIGVELFGSMWEDLGSEVILSMGNASGALKNVEGSTARAGQALDQSLGSKVTKIKNQFLLWAKDMGDKLMPTFQAIADWVLANMPAIQATLTSVFGGIGTAVSTVASILGSIIGFVSQNIAVFQALGIVIASFVIPPMLGFILNAGIMKTKALMGMIVSAVKLIATNYALGISFLAANAPILLIIAGIIALIAVVVLIIKHWDTVKAVTIAVWNAIKDFLLAVWEGIKAVAIAVWSGIASFFSALWDGIKSVATTVWGGIKTFFTTIWNAIKAVGIGIWNGIKIAFMAVWNAIKAYFTLVLTGYKIIFMTIWNAIKVVGTTIWKGIKVAFMAVWNAIKTYFTTVLNGYKIIFTTVWNAIKAVAIAIWNGLKSAATSVFNAIKSVISSATSATKSVLVSIWNAIKSFIISTFNSIRSKASSAWNAIKSVISSVVGAIKSVVSSQFNAIKSIAINAWSAIRSAISSMVNGIRSKVSSAASFMRSTFAGAISAVKGFFGGLWSSISGSLSNVVSGIKSKVMAAKEWLTELNPFKRHSPSLVDNVLAGTKIIKKTYEGLGGMQIAPPQIGNVSAGRINVNEAFGNVEGGKGGGTNYNAPLVQVENMNVRNDQDVRNVSRELFGLQRSHDRAKGGR